MSAPITDGYYSVAGLTDEYPRFWLVKTHQDSGVNGGRPYVCAWGLSLWGREGEEPTWAYRTFGNRLSILRERYPAATWTPDHDRAAEMDVPVALMTPRDPAEARKAMAHEFGVAPRVASLGGRPCIHCGQAADESFADECPARLRSALDSLAVELAGVRGAEMPLLDLLSEAADDAIDPDLFRRIRRVLRERGYGARLRADARELLDEIKAARK